MSIKANIVIDIKEYSKTIHYNGKIYSKFIHCGGMIFNSIRECANYYGTNRSTMNNWIKGENTMPLNFQKLNLRYATRKDLNTFPIYKNN